MTNYDNYIAPSRIECSGRVLKELGIPNKKVGLGVREVDPFFCWFMNCFYYEKWNNIEVHFVNHLTHFPVIATYRDRIDILQPNQLLCNCLEPIILKLGFSKDTMYKFLAHLYQPEITKTIIR